MPKNILEKIINKTKQGLHANLPQDSFPILLQGTVKRKEVRL